MTEPEAELRGRDDEDQVAAVPGGGARERPRVKPPRQAVGDGHDVIARIQARDVVADSADVENADVVGGGRITAHHHPVPPGGLFAVHLEAVALHEDLRGTHLARATLASGEQLPPVQRIVHREELERVAADRCRIPLDTHVAVRDGGDQITPIAVLVDAVVRHLRATGVNARRRVVAVRAVCDVARGLVASERRHAGVAEGVAVPVHVPGRGVDCVRVRVVHRTVAVVVHSIAHFRCAWVHGDVRIVTVRAVHAVAGRFGARRRGDRRVAVQVPVGIGVERDGAARLIHEAVAVVVHHVAHLGRRRIDRRAGGGVVVTVRADEQIISHLHVPIHRVRGAGILPVGEDI